MPTGPTYYDFFGVRQNASAEQIRSAYLWLMKQHHPDRTDHVDRQRAADFAAILNRCYDVLKDPLKRARYDAWLARDERQSGGTRVRRALLTGDSRRKRAKKWDASSRGAAALAATIAFVVAGAIWLPDVSPFQQSVAAGIAYQPGVRAAVQLSDEDARSQVRRAMDATPSQAERSSERCFETARDEGSLRGTEMCVIFDDAYLEWNRTTNLGQAQPVYLNDSIARLRHRDALAAIGLFEDARLDQLKQTALNAMLAEIKSQVNAAANLDSPDPSVDFRHKMSRSGTSLSKFRSSGLTAN